MIRHYSYAWAEGWFGADSEGSLLPASGTHTTIPPLPWSIPHNPPSTSPPVIGFLDGLAPPELYFAGGQAYLPHNEHHSPSISSILGPVEKSSLGLGRSIQYVLTQSKNLDHLSVCTYRREFLQPPHQPTTLLGSPMQSLIGQRTCLGGGTIKSL